MFSIFSSGFLLSAVIALIQLSDAYLRYLAFKESMTEEEKRSLWRRLTMCAVIATFLYAGFLSDESSLPFCYKSVLMLGWIPYLGIFMYGVRRGFWHHIFVFGMSALWSFSQHNWSSIATAAFLDATNVDFFILIHASLYILWFILFFPIERQCFGKLLKASVFFSEKGVLRCVALLPLIVLFGPMILMADAELLHSWEERVSRLLLPLIFFFLYYNVLAIAEHIYGRMVIEQESKVLKAELSFLTQNYEMMKQNNEELKILRHDMKHSYRIIHSMLSAGKTKNVFDYIKKNEQAIEDTVLAAYSDSPIINAALSVYFHRAEKAGLTVEYKINLPPRLFVAEEDFAILLANLLENAINASLKSKSNRKPQISLLIQSAENKLTFEITNVSDEPLTLGENGLPTAKEAGHGVGMISVLSFIKKYDAYADYSKDGDIVKFAMYLEKRALF